jgi:hypothetical protein
MKTAIDALVRAEKIDEPRRSGQRAWQREGG